MVLVPYFLHAVHAALVVSVPVHFSRPNSMFARPAATFLSSVHGLHYITEPNVLSNNNNNNIHNTSRKKGTRAVLYCRTEAAPIRRYHAVYPWNYFCCGFAVTLRKSIRFGFQQKRIQFPRILLPQRFPATMPYYFSPFHLGVMTTKTILSYRSTLKGTKTGRMSSQKQKTHCLLLFKQKDLSSFEIAYSCGSEKSCVFVSASHLM